MPLPDEIAQSIPEDIRGDASLQNFNDVGGLAKSYIETKRMVGSAIHLPPKDAKPEDIQKWKSDHLPKLAGAGLWEGPPESPDKYEFQWGENYKLDGELEKDFRAMLHREGLSPKQANAIVEFEKARYEKASQSEQQNFIQGDMVVENFKKQYAGDFDSRMQSFTELVKARNSDAFNNFLSNAVILETQPDGSVKKYYAGDHPQVFDLLSDLGALIADDSAGNWGNGRGMESADTIQAQIDELRKSDKYKAGDAATVERVDNLYKKRYGTKEVNAKEVDYGR